jgi:hypothetical protein
MQPDSAATCTCGMLVSSPAAAGVIDRACNLQLAISDIYIYMVVLSSRYSLDNFERVRVTGSAVK